MFARRRLSPEASFFKLVGLAFKLFFALLKLGVALLKLSYQAVKILVVGVFKGIKWLFTSNSPKKMDTSLQRIYAETNPSKRGFMFERWIVDNLNSRGHKAAIIKDLMKKGILKGVSGYDGGMDIYCELSNGRRLLIQSKFYSSPLEEEVLSKTVMQVEKEFKPILGDDIIGVIVTNSFFKAKVCYQRAKQSGVFIFDNSNLHELFQQPTSKAA